MAKNTEGSTIHCINVSELPSSPFRATENKAKISQMIKQHANEKMEQFVDQFLLEEVEVTTGTLIDDGKGLADMIRDESVNQEADMVVMGSRGETFISWLLLGSTTEKNATGNREYPSNDC